MNKSHFGVVAQEWVQGPKNVFLEGGELIWTVCRHRVSKDDVKLVNHPIDGCLKAFIRLKGAGQSPHLVLAFAKKWGVLALNPAVSSEGAVKEGDAWREANQAPVQYREPVSLYVYLAALLVFFHG